jgi:hypothetical protein
MPAGAAADIDHPHSFLDDVVKEIKLGAQERLNLGWLRRRIECPIQ